MVSSIGSLYLFYSPLHHNELDIQPQIRHGTGPIFRRCTILVRVRVSVRLTVSRLGLVELRNSGPRGSGTVSGQG